MATSQDYTPRLGNGGVQRFELQHLVCEGRHTLVLAGELDMAAALDLEIQIVAHADRAWSLTLDLSKLSFMDSTGLHLILFARDLCQVKGAEFALIPGPRQVQRIFELTGLLDRLPFQIELAT
ncbi:MAG: STAS domain-containing protein [Actinobacteria bacterium]|nr:MAG: STAS domain-containing protein [Actinomycetota bacterium]